MLCASVIGAQTLIVVVPGRLFQPAYQAKDLEKDTATASADAPYGRPDALLKREILCEQFSVC
jgi:hypothetical protein